MPTPTINVIGVYPVPDSPELFASAMELKYGGLELSSMERRQAEEAVRSELASVVLIECCVRNSDERFDIGDFGQVDSDQSPYDEAFLSDDGTALGPERYTQPDVPQFRFCFFLHFFDPAKPLNTPYGSVTLPLPSPMPLRVRALVPYDPVT